MGAPGGAANSSTIEFHDQHGLLSQNQSDISPGMSAKPHDNKPSLIAKQYKETFLMSSVSTKAELPIETSIMSKIIDCKYDRLLINKILLKIDIASA